MWFQLSCNISGFIKSRFSVLYKWFPIDSTKSASKDYKVMTLMILNSASQNTVDQILRDEQQGSAVLYLHS